MLEIIKTDDGYMVQHTDGELEGECLCDADGNNLFDTYAEAEAVFYGIREQTPWGKANAAFYAWEKDFGEESDLSDDDRMIWVEGYLQALRDAK
jgi:hypothetical protein